MDKRVSLIDDNNLLIFDFSVVSKLKSSKINFIYDDKIKETFIFLLYWKSVNLF